MGATPSPSIGPCLVRTAARPAAARCARRGWRSRGEHREAAGRALPGARARASGRSPTVKAFRPQGGRRPVSRSRGDLVRGLYVDPNAGRVPFREYAESWRASRVHRPTTAALVESHLRHHVLPFFGDRPLGSIRSSDVQSWVKGRSAVLAPTTVKVAYRFLSAIFRSALRDRLIVTNPCEQIKLPRIDRRLVVPLETDAVVRPAEAMPVRYRATVILASGAGLRQGEVLGLQVRHMDFRAQRALNSNSSPSAGHRL